MSQLSAVTPRGGATLAGRWGVTGAVAAFAGALALVFHDRFWWAPDEGAYAYVASRILAGDTLNGTVQDLHAGYINLWHAAMFRLFGEDLVSLRYPLAVLTVAAAVIAARLLRPAGRDIALAGGVAMAVFFFLPFLNPTANWYAVFLALVIVAVLAWWPADWRWRWETVGVLLATLFLFRQLSGVIVGLGVVGYLAATIEGPGPRRLARGLVVVAMVGLGGYLWLKGSIGGFVLIGIWPLLLLARIGWSTRAGDAAMAGAVARVAAGGVVGLLPMVAFHLLQGTLATWIGDTLVSAFRLTGLAFVGEAELVTFAALAALALVSGEAWGALGGAHWLALVAAPAVVGVAMVRRWPADPVTRHPLAILAPFFAVTALHFQIPIYLTYTSGFTVIALLWLAGGASVGVRCAAMAGVGAVALVALLGQTAQPLSRGGAGIAAGERRALTADGLPRASLWMEAAEAAEYDRLLAAIDRYAPADAPILVLPMNAEVYFLAERRAPVRFFTTALGVQTEDDVDKALAALAAVPPAVLIHRRVDKYNTPLSNALFDALRAKFDLRERIGGFDLYVPADGRTSDPARP